MFLSEKRCPICGKEFYPRAGWVYKSQGKEFCSWKCFRKDEHSKKASTPRHTRDSKVDQLTSSGKYIKTFDSAIVAAESLDCRYISIMQACRSGFMFHGFRWRYTPDEVPEVSE